MAETFEVHLHSGSAWDISIGASDYIGFGGDSGALAPISQDAYQRYTCKTDGSMSANSGTGQNCKYVSTTEISLNGAAAVTLNTTNVATTACSTRWHYTDSAGNTELSNVRFFAYQGSPSTAPTDVTVVAFERANASIGTDTDSGSGRGWNTNYGVGGSANGLQCASQSSAADHYFYIGVSCKPTSRGVKTFTFRLEFDVT